MKGLTISKTIGNAAFVLRRNWYLIAFLGFAFCITMKEQSTASLRFGFGMITVGIALNLLAIVANGGRMPVRLESVDSSHSADYEPIHEESRFILFGDWIKIRERLFSPGDVLLLTGVATVLVDYLVSLSS